MTVSQLKSSAAQAPGWQYAADFTNRTRMSRQDARWIDRQIAANKNMPPAARRRMARAARGMVRTIGYKAMRELLLNSSLPGKALQLALELADALAPPAQPTQMPRVNRRFYRAGDRVRGIGMSTWTASGPATNLVALPQNLWPFNKWEAVLAGGVFLHIYDRPYTSGLKRYAYTTTLTAAQTTALPDGLPSRVHIPNRVNKGRYRRMETVPIFNLRTSPFMVRQGKVSPPSAGPPPKGEREAKVSPKTGRTMAIIRELIGGTTEAMDFIEVVYAASGGYDGGGLQRNPYWGFEEKVRWLMDGGIANLDFDRFVFLMAVESFSDAAIARFNKKNVDNWKKAGWSAVVGPTAGPAL